MKKKIRKHNFMVHTTKLRLIAFVLVWMLLLSVVPPISFAAEEKISVNDQEFSAEETEPIYTYTEITEMRDCFTKHFRRSDGKVVAIVYYDKSCLPNLNVVSKTADLTSGENILYALFVNKNNAPL